MGSRGGGLGSFFRVGGKLGEEGDSGFGSLRGMDRMLEQEMASFFVNAFGPGWTALGGSQLHKSSVEGSLSPHASRCNSGESLLPVGRKGPPR